MLYRAVVHVGYGMVSFFGLTFVTWSSAICSISRMRPPLAEQVGLQTNRPVNIATICLSMVPRLPLDSAASRASMSGWCSTSSRTHGTIPYLHSGSTELSSVSASASLHFGSSNELCSSPSVMKEARTLTVFPLKRSLFATSSPTLVSIGFGGTSGFDCADTENATETKASAQVSQQARMVRITGSHLRCRTIFSSMPWPPLLWLDSCMFQACPVTTLDSRVPSKSLVDSVQRTTPYETRGVR